MNARQIYSALEDGDKEQMQKALRSLLSTVQIAGEAILELDGYLRLRDGKEPLVYRTRTVLSEFIELGK